MQTIAARHFFPSRLKRLGNGDGSVILFWPAPRPIESLKEKLAQFVVDLVEKSKGGMGAPGDQFARRVRSRIKQIQGNDVWRLL